jgi:hypothetical protein
METYISTLNSVPKFSRIKRKILENVLFDEMYVWNII